MALQEYLVSYGVKVDEAAAERLFSVLEEDRLRAAEVTAAFTALDGAVKTFSESVAALGTADGLKKSGILTASEMKKLTPVISLKADTAGFLKEAEAVLNEARGMAAGMTLTVPVKLQPDLSAFGDLKVPDLNGGDTRKDAGMSQQNVNISVQTSGGNADGVARAVADALERRLAGGGFA